MGSAYANLPASEWSPRAREIAFAHAYDLALALLRAPTIERGLQEIESATGLQLELNDGAVDFRGLTTVAAHDVVLCWSAPRIEELRKIAESGASS